MSEPTETQKGNYTLEELYELRNAGLDAVLYNGAYMAINTLIEVFKITAPDPVEDQNQEKPSTGNEVTLENWEEKLEELYWPTEPKKDAENIYKFIQHLLDLKGKEMIEKKHKEFEAFLNGILNFEKIFTFIPVPDSIMAPFVEFKKDILELFKTTFK